MSEGTERAKTLPAALAVIAPGILVAATGVGAGDLATAAFTGSELGVAVLWAVLVGAGLKLVVTEGLARHQLVTGKTLLEGAVGALGRPVAWVFLPYLLLWSFFVGSALMSACGVTLVAIFPVFEPATGKVVFGLAASLAGVALVGAGGFVLFERVMAVSVGVMFTVVLVTAALLWPGAGPVLRGLVPDATTLGDGLGWTVALMGGVGGTLTVLSYGYWIRESGREGPEALSTCRIDLSVGYAVTAVFGLAMVVIGSTLEIEKGKSAALIVDLASQLEARLGPAGRWAFLVGAFGAVFSSLLGVWQSVPYLFADFLSLVKGEEGEVDVAGRAYRGYLLGLALVPALGLLVEFKRVQKLYAVIGACFLPLLALALLHLNRERFLGQARNRPATVALLALTVAFFAHFGWTRLT
jgi:Mn2+/Fe2+ NRAMP family transporter